MGIDEAASALADAADELTDVADEAGAVVVLDSQDAADAIEDTADTAIMLDLAQRVAGLEAMASVPIAHGHPEYALIEHVHAEMTVRDEPPDIPMPVTPPEIDEAPSDVPPVNRHALFARPFGRNDA